MTATDGYMSYSDADIKWFTLCMKLSKEIKKGNQINFIKKRQGGYTILINQKQ